MVSNRIVRSEEIIKGNRHVTSASPIIQNHGGGLRANNPDVCRLATGGCAVVGGQSNPIASVIWRVDSNSCPDWSGLQARALVIKRSPMVFSSNSLTLGAHDLSAGPHRFILCSSSVWAPNGRLDAPNYAFTIGKMPPAPVTAKSVTKIVSKTRTARTVALVGVAYHCNPAGNNCVTSRPGATMVAQMLVDNTSWKTVGTVKTNSVGRASFSMMSDQRKHLWRLVTLQSASSTMIILRSGSPTFVF